MPHASTSHAVPADAETPLGGQYRLGRCLGSGGMGTVWQAQDCRLKRQVAIKFLDTQQVDAAAAEQRFQREAMLAASLQSPHVVQIFAQGCTPEGRPYIVMELLEGEDLRDLIARAGPLDPQLTLSILEQMSVGLSHAHHQGLVHRDIKPPNIFLVPQQSGRLFVKLLDFGVAKDIHTPITKLTFTGAFIGTLFYISPEQLSDPQRVGPSADIWATAVTAYEMLTGTVPFGAGAAVPELLFKISKGTHVPPTAANPSLPRALDQVFEKAFRIKPEERYRTINELSNALSRALFSDPDLRPTLRSHELELPPSKQLSLRSMAFAGLAVLVLCFMSTWWVLHSERSEHPVPLAAAISAPLQHEDSTWQTQSQAIEEEPAAERGIAPPEAAPAPAPKPKLTRPVATKAPTPPRVVNYGF